MTQFKIYLFTILALSCTTTFAQDKYEASWESLKNYEAPEWYEDAKLGFWVHWGVYSIPAFQGDHASEWYGRWMYCQKDQSTNNKGLATHLHHHRKYGSPEKFGYKDFIPMFTAENFDADEWADLCVSGGAKFFTMMGVHHDAFCLWDTQLSQWNSVNMGPKRDLVGEMAKATRAKGLKFGVSNHSGWNYCFFQWNHFNRYDATNPENQDLYGNPIIQESGDTLRRYKGESHMSWIDRSQRHIIPSERDMSRWLARSNELADMYKPDLYYFDWGFKLKCWEPYRKEFGSFYYNNAVEAEKGSFGKPGVVINYKSNFYAKGSAVKDFERGGMKGIGDMVWQTDDCVYNGHTWGYSEGLSIKSTNTIIDELVDIVSKRGILMLSFAPKADGTFPDDQKQLIKEMGAWLDLCGEAIYSTRPWKTFGETLESDSLIEIRFTRNKSKDVLYATLLDWKNDQVIIQSINNESIPQESIKKVSLIGSGKLKWKMTEAGLVIQMPHKQPDYDYAFPIKIEFRYSIDMPE